MLGCAMDQLFVTVLIASPEIAKIIQGRYVCLIRSGNKDRWFIDNSLINLSNETSEYDLDWRSIEKSLGERGAFQV